MTVDRFPHTLEPLNGTSASLRGISSRRSRRRDTRLGVRYVPRIEHASAANDRQIIVHL